MKPSTKEKKCIVIYAINEFFGFPLIYLIPFLISGKQVLQDLANTSVHCLNITLLATDSSQVEEELFYTF